MLRLVYSALLYAFAPIALLVTALRGVRDPLYRDRLAERYGFTRLTFPARPLWVHAVSVGEVQAAAALIRALQQRYAGMPMLITTATPTGAQRVRSLFGERVSHAFLPYDTPGAVKRFLGRVRPRLLVVMETEVWPNLFRGCARRDIPLVLASARLSKKSVERFRWLASLFRDTLDGPVTIAAQSETDAARFRAVGADPARVQVTGNIKFDMEEPVRQRADGAAVRVAQFPLRPVWVAGSTHEGEEEMVLDAHIKVRKIHAAALAILVPRHPDRFERVRALLGRRGIPYACRSRGDAVRDDHSVLLVDTLGELLTFYAACDVAFVAGSLVPIGGHNLLEPAALSRAIVTGSYNFNSQDVADLFFANDAAVQVGSADELALAVSDLLLDDTRRRALGDHARAIVATNRGALARVMALIEAVLPATRPDGMMT